MKRDILIALAIGAAAVTPFDATGHPVLYAVMVAAGAWYLLVGTNPANGKKRGSARHQ